jgi:hypothetical protein
MALYLSTSVRSGPPLKMGTMFASFHLDGCSPVSHAVVRRVWSASRAAGPPYLPVCFEWDGVSACGCPVGACVQGSGDLLG